MPSISLALYVSPEMRFRFRCNKTALATPCIFAIFFSVSLSLAEYLQTKMKLCERLNLYQLM